ncbi:hypothetical protein JCM6882_007517 [Rhodosporidiobolus microsporus]
MKVSGLLALSLVGGATLGAAYTSPPVSARIQASWSEASLVTQYLETLALEAPNELLPFLSFLDSHPNAYRSLQQPLKPRSYAAAQQLERSGINPVFAPDGLLRQNETLAILEAAATRSLRLRAKGLRESMQLSLANKEASVRIEAMHTIWEAREKEVEEWEKERFVDEDGVVAHERDKFRQGDVKAKKPRHYQDEACESWIDIGGKKACTPQEFWLVVGQEQQGEKVPIKLPSDLPSPARPQLYPLDHLSPPGSNSRLPRVVLYGSPSSPTFQALFSFLYSLSAPKAVPTGAGAALTTSKNLAAPHPPRLQFVLRWKPSTRKSVSGEALELPKLALSGYGAALDIKKSDYLAIDDRLASGAGAKTAPDDHTEPILEIEGNLAPKMEPVKKSDVPELSLRSAQFILNSAEPLKAFTALTSTFPRLASHLSTLVPEPDPHLLSELSMNQMDLPMLTMRPGFFLNGLQLTEAEIDPFALLRLMRKERKYLSDLSKVHGHLRGKDVRTILIDGSPKSKGNPRSGVIDAEALGELYDATDRHEGGQVILWFNNLQKDSRYKSWSKSVGDLLRPTYPGAMNLVARNLNNVVFILDLSQPSAISLLTESVKQFITRGIPVRFGVVPLVNEEGQEKSIETKVAQVVWYLVDALGRTPLMKFLGDIQKASPDAAISEDLLRRAYAILRNTNQHIDGGPLATFDEVQAGVDKKASSMHSRLSKTRDYLKRLAIPLLTSEQTGKTSIGSFLMNGAFFPIDEDFTQNLQRTLGLHTQFLQQEAYSGALTDKHDASQYFAELPSTHRRRNPFIFPSLETNPLKIVNLVEAFDGVDPRFVNNFYIEGAADRINETTGLDIEDPPAVATMLIIGELNDEAGIQLARAALKLADKTTRVRISFLHNPQEPYTAHPWALSNVLYLLHRYSSFPEILPVEILNWIDLDISGEGPLPEQGREWSDENPLKAALGGGANGMHAPNAELWWEEMQWLGHQLGFKPGENGIVVNGRVIGPFPDDAFELPDLQDLLDYELDKRINAVAAAVNRTSLDFALLTRQQQSHIINLASSIVGVASLPDPTQGLFGGGPTERRRDYLRLTANHSSVIDSHENGAFYEIAVVVDPATETAQRWAPILKTLSQLTFVHTRLYLNPAFHLDDIPIKRFFEYSFHPALEFDEQTGSEVQPGIRFDNIPEDILLTFSADVQKSWLAFPKTSVHDLDNIRLADLPAAYKERGVEATLELQALVVEGHARDMPSSKPPRGLQLELLSVGQKDTENKTVDTIVMANLGYFQLKANPGPWHLAIRPGRSSEVFELESVGANGWKSGAVGSTGDSLYVSTLEGLTLYPRFSRKPGHELTELLDESATAAGKKKEGSILERVKNMIPFFAPKPAAIATTTKRADINVFTVASGLLYERMAFLMMVSVMRHTQSTVKFWFIENFLSPSFKAFIPHVAKEYGFDYELVTYKWPHWLRPQKEKQRTIWAYKILFLDVLFPLELDRVIFVDSDQIVRADLKELIELDLNGAPYAYAPMGDDREEMEGFRFWKDGYWKQHLQGKPYHISALYLVDLDRFRQIAAGDRLRQQYQALSADPNSLANLDQDLPNNMQNVIPIHTLDQNWLWCETWCSDEGLSTAKTIDLCNNPLTKEEKLKRAKRLIPEWTVYDDEVAALARRVAAESSDASAFTTKADELEQAVQQQKEREELVREKEQEKVEHVKDEL